MANEDKRTFTGTMSFDSGKGNTMRIRFLEVENSYVCKYCDDEVTLDQIKKTIGKTVGSRQTTNINKILPFINKYRKDFGLDTCLKKLIFLHKSLTKVINFILLKNTKDRIIGQRIKQLEKLLVCQAFLVILLLSLMKLWVHLLKSI